MDWSHTRWGLPSISLGRQVIELCSKNDLAGVAITWPGHLSVDGRSSLHGGKSLFRQMWCSIREAITGVSGDILVL
jgi:hypothetical protein